MDSVTIRKRSGELDLPFSNLLVGYILESIVCMIAQSPWRDDIWLCNREILGVDRYRKKCGRRLIYRYRIENENPNQKLISYFQEQAKTFGYSLQGETQGEIMSLDINMEGMYVPVQMEMKESREDHIFPQEETLTWTMDEKKKISYFHYPYEHVMAVYIFEIIKNLELINDMDYYLKAYDLLDHTPLDGRRVKDSLADLCQKNNITNYGTRYQSLKGYETYAYMKKKWKVVLRRHRRAEPSWEQVIKKLLLFLTPIWDALEEDRVFFGDWMPELQRFLD